MSRGAGHSGRRPLVHDGASIAPIDALMRWSSTSRGRSPGERKESGDSGEREVEPRGQGVRIRRAEPELGGIR